MDIETIISISVYFFIIDRNFYRRRWYLGIRISLVIDFKPCQIDLDFPF